MLTCGIIGALVAYFAHFSTVVDVMGIKSESPSLQIPMQAALGAVSAIVFLSLLSNTDRSDMPRLVAIALLAGIFWKPVFDLGEVYIQKRQEDGKVATINATKDEITAKLAANPNDPTVRVDFQNFLETYKDVLPTLESPKARDTLGTGLTELLQEPGIASTTWAPQAFEKTFDAHDIAIVPDASRLPEQFKPLAAF